MDGYVTIKTEIDTKQFDAQIDYIKGRMQDIENQLMMADKGYEVGDTQKLEAEYEKLGNQLMKLQMQKESVASTPIENSSDLSDIGSKISSIITKVGRWALAVFGVRSAYMAIRKAISILSQYNSQLSVDIQYIQYAMAKMLEPLITWLVQQVYQLLAFINSIAMAWFGINLFANASASSMKQTATSAKELKNTLAGFDEVNTLGDTSSSGSGASAATPSMDLSQMQGTTPEWLQWIYDNGAIVIGIIGGIAAALIVAKASLTGIQGLGIGLMIAGIVLYIGDVIAYLNNPTWDNFAKYLADIGLVVIGLGLLISGPTGLIVAIIGGIILLVATIIKNWDTISAFLMGIVNWINQNIIQPIANFFVWLWNGILGGINWYWNIVKGIINTIVSVVQNYLINPITWAFSNMWNGISNGANWLWSGIKNVINWIIDGINKLIRGMNKISVNVPSWLGGGTWGIHINEIPRLASGGIVNIPNTGMRLGNSIVGESGAEGVLPLTNSDTMKQLGQEIGKWITLNVDLTNTIDGRVLSNRLETIKNQNNFSRNGG